MNKNADTVSGAISDAADNVGYALSDEIKNVWDPALILGGQKDVLSVYGDDFLNCFTTVIDVVDQINKAVNDRYTNSAAEGIVKQMENNSSGWKNADDETRAGIHEQNSLLADQYRLATGDNVYYDSQFGTWHHEDGTLLYGNTDDVVGKVVGKMKANSNAWTTSSPEDRKKLSEQNAYYAKYIGKILGKDLHIGNDGVWYMNDGTPLYEYADKVVSSIVQKMKANSSAWTGSSPEKKEKLSEENNNYGEQIAYMTGEKVWRDEDGVWHIGNEELYKKYHTGLNQGIVGQSSLKDNEELAILLAD